MITYNILWDTTQGVGAVALTAVTGSLSGERTAGGARLRFPATLSFPGHPQIGPLSLEGLEAKFLPLGDGTEIARARCEQPFCSGMLDQRIEFSWDATFHALAFYERMRDGHEAKFAIKISGWLRPLLKTDDGQRKQSGQPSLTNRYGETYDLAGAGRVAHFQADTVVTYSREVWTNTMRQIGFRDSILIEIPYEAKSPKGWESVWGALVDARNFLDSGGSTGWKGASTSVRLALEEWNKIEPEATGPEKLWDRTKQHRIDAIRAQLRSLANFSAHTKADEWTRDDALLLVSTLSALIATRNP